MQRIEVISNVGSSPSQSLEREVWAFWFDDRDGALVLDLYRHETRKSLRHRTWDVQTAYSRLNSRAERFGKAEQCDPPLPEFVKDEAIRQFINQVTVRKETR